MMLRSIPEPDEPEARTTYQNLHNLVEKATVQPAEINWKAPIDTDNLCTRSILTWHKEALPSQSSRSRVPLKNCLGDIYGTRHILNN